MQNSDWIALIAVCVALLSSLYARHAVGEARRANDIAINNQKLRIYRGVMEIYGLLMRKGVQIREGELFNHYEYIQLSEFYFNSSIYKKLYNAFDGAWEIVRLHDCWEAAEKREEKVFVEKTRAQLRQVRDQFKAIADEIRNHLRLGSHVVVFDKAQAAAEVAVELEIPRRVYVSPPERRILVEIYVPERLAGQPTGDHVRYVRVDRNHVRLFQAKRRQKTFTRSH